MPQGFLYSETTNYVLYIISLVFFCAYTLGLQCGMVIPSLITGERILTIFFPLKNNFILTRRRTIIAVWFLYIVNGGFFVYQYILCRQFKHFIVEGVAVSGFMYTDIYIHDVRSGLYTLIRRVVNYMTGLIPICLVTVGSCCYWHPVGFNYQETEGAHPQSSQGNHKRISKTTKTLLSICVLYIVCSGFAFLIEYVTTVAPFDEDLPLKSVLGSVQDWFICISCVGDFVIYVGANNSFRKTGTAKIRLNK